MNILRPVKVIRNGTSLAFVIPARVCRELGICRGDYFNLHIGDKNTLVAERLKVAEFGNFEEARDKELELLQHE